MKMPFAFISVLVMLLWVGCGKNAGLDSQVSTTSYRSLLSKPALLDTLKHGALVEVTVIRDGVPVQDVEVAFSLSIAGAGADYQWQGTTNADGYAEIVITTAPFSQLWPLLPPAINLDQLEPNGATGYYMAKATYLASREVVGKWHSIFINGSTRTVLSLPIGDRFRVLSQDTLLYFEDQTFVVQTIDSLSVEEFDQKHDSLIFPLEIRLVNFNPIAPIGGQVRFSHVGWLDIARFRRKDSFLVPTPSSVEPIEEIFFSGLVITASHITGWFAPTGRSIDGGYYFFTAEIAGSSKIQIGGIR